MDLKSVIRTIPDFPQEGILFRDITTVLQDAESLRLAIDQISEKLKDCSFELVLGPESRGFIFGVPVAYNMSKGFIPVRKAGKLPHKTVRKTYSLEYGEATIEMHEGSVSPGQKIVIVDDLLATGGTCKAIIELVEEMGGIVEAIVFLIELKDLGGREVLKGYNIHSLVKY